MRRDSAEHRALTDPVRALAGRFREFDELSQAVEGWDLDWRQLDSGRLDAELLQLRSRATLLTRVWFSRRFFQHGGSPPGMRTFGLVGNRVPTISWCGRRIESGVLLPFPDEYESTSEPNFAGTTLSVTEGSLRRAARRLGLGEERLDLPPDGVPVQCDRESVLALRVHLSRLFEAAGTNLHSLAADAYHRALDEELPELLLLALTSARPDDPRRRGPRGDRQRIARQGRRLLEAQADEPPAITEICRELGVSRRTLEYAFRDHVGVSPKRYLDLLRLFRVRSELRHADPSVRVADAPSQTRHRSSGRP